MRLKSIILSSTSAAIFMLGAAPAAAQSQPATPPDDSAQAQETPADPEAGSAQTDDAVQGADGSDQADAGEEIVVTGLRRSLQTSQNIKRNSEQIVDVIVAEDIGKLPDRTVSEALARVPGVTVERAQAEAGDVFVRGLRDPATTYNGREIFTAEARNVAPQDFPAGGVAALEVFKSLTAEQIEGNLAGSINVRSRRPFDFRGFELAGSLNATYADLAKDWAGNGNLLVSNRWDMGDGGELGALVNVSYTELSYNDNIRFSSGDFFGINPIPGRPGLYEDQPPFDNIPGTTVRVPVVVGVFQNDGKRKRPSANASLQWRPNSDLEFYVDGLYQGFRRQVSDRSLNVPLYADAEYTNVEIGQRGREFFYPQRLTAQSCCVPDGFQAATSERTNTYQFAVGGVYDTESLRISADVARTDSQFDLSIYSVDYRLSSVPTVNVVFEGEGDGGTQFNFEGVETGNLGAYQYRGFFDRHLTAKGDDVQMRLDATLKEMTSWARGIDFGVRYNIRDAGFGNAERYAPYGGPAMPLANLPLDFMVNTLRFRDDNQPVQFLAQPTYDSIRGSIAALRGIAGFPNARPQFGAADDRTGPFDDYTAEETSLTGYVQLRYGFDAGSIPIDGVIGLRAIKTTFSLLGTVENQGVRSALKIDNEYTDYLPNVSIRARLLENFQLRLAYTETRRRPDFSQLNPGLRLDPPPGSPLQARTGSGGNPFLEPVLSSNYDLSAEYYFSRTGFVALAAFRRDIKNYIVNFEATQDIPGVGPVQVRGPVNISEGRLQGIEGQFRTFFDFMGLPAWVEGFGTELNVTYIDNELDAPPSFGAIDQVQIPEVSRWTYNIVGFYEQGPLTARVAYNYRSQYRQSFDEGPGGILTGEFTRGVSRLDASISYTLNDNLTVAADVSNILGKPFRNYRDIDGIFFPRDVRYEERVYSIGIRSRF
jgi:iron complex outermembrane receptor protein